MRVGTLLEHSDHRAAFAEFQHFVPGNEKRSEVAGVRVRKHPGGDVEISVEKRGVAVVRSITKDVAIQARDKFRRAALAIKRGLAAQRGLQAGHQ